MLTLNKKQPTIPQVDQQRRGPSGAVRRWRRLVRIAYFDEAGVAHERQEPFLVVGGVLVHGDYQWNAIQSATDEIATTIVPKELWDTFYFHAMHLYHDHKSYKGLLSVEDRFELLRQLVHLIARVELPISYGAVKRAALRVIYPNDSQVEDRTHFAHQMAFTLCATGFQQWFARECADEVAIAVADKNDAKNRQLHLKQTYATQRTQGLPGMPLVMLFNFVDALHFAAQQESIGLQLADVAAFIIKRHLMEKEDTEKFYKILEPCIKVNPADALLGT